MASTTEALGPIILSIGDESFARLVRYPETISKSAESLKKILTPENIPARFIRDDLEARYRLYTAPLTRLAMTIGILGALNDPDLKHGNVFLQAMIEQTTNKVCGIECVTTRADGETITTGDLTSLGTMNLLETILEGGAERSIETSQVGYVLLSIIRDRRPVELRRVTGQTHVSGFAEMMQQKGYLQQDISLG